MAMRVEKYTTRGEAVPVATRLAALFRWAAVVCILLMVHRSGTPRAAFVESGRLLLDGGTVDVFSPPDSGIVWEDAGHMILTTTRLFYLDAAFQVQHRTNFGEPLFVTANAAGYLTYRKVGEEISAFDRHGTKLYTSKSKAYPRLKADPGLVFLMTGDQSGLGFLGRDGSELGTFQQLGALVTAFDSCAKTGTVYLGQITGHLEQYHPASGKTLWRRQVAGSRVTLIKGLSAATDGRGVAVLSGLDPERYSLLAPDGSVLWSVRTGGAVKTAVGIRAGRTFCAGLSDNRAYLLRRTDGGEVFSADPPRSPEPLRFLDLADTPDGSRTLFAWGSSRTSEVVLVDRDGAVLFHKAYPSPFAHVRFNRSGNAFTIQTAAGIDVYNEGGLL